MKSVESLTEYFWGYLRNPRFDNMLKCAQPNQDPVERSQSLKKQLDQYIEVLTNDPNSHSLPDSLQQIIVSSKEGQPQKSNGAASFELENNVLQNKESKTEMAETPDRNNFLNCRVTVSEYWTALIAGIIFLCFLLMIAFQQYIYQVIQSPSTTHGSEIKAAPAGREQVESIPNQQGVLEQIQIEQPWAYSFSPDEPIYQTLNSELLDWNDLKKMNRTNVRGIEFKGKLNPSNISALIGNYGHGLTYISFHLDNLLCDECFGYNDLAPGIKSLHGIRFVGDTECPEVYAFVKNEINLKRLKYLEFKGTKIFPTNVKAIQTLFELTQTALEHLTMKGVSLCSDCKLFENVTFTNIKHGELGFKTEADVLNITINMFSSNIPEDCLATTPDTKTFIVDCKGKALLEEA